MFLGREISESRDYSEKIAEEIDEEVRRIIDDAQQRARELLRKHRATLEKLVTVLMEVETLEGDRLEKLLDSDPNEPWTNDQNPQGGTPVQTPPAEAPRPANFQPRPGGLAWEGGSTTRIDGPTA